MPRNDVKLRSKKSQSTPKRAARQKLKKIEKPHKRTTNGKKSPRKALARKSISRR